MSQLVDGDVASLTAALRGCLVISDTATLAAIGRDHGEGAPRAVVVPGTVEDAQAALCWATERRVPVVIRGRGTRTPDGLTMAGSLVLSTEALLGVTVDADTGLAVAMAGTPAAEVRRAAEAAGWALPTVSPHPTSTIGGDVATDARALLPRIAGTTADHVAGLKVVLADGTAVQVLSTVATARRHLSLARLFTGSHGLLGMITQVTLKLAPKAPPAHMVTALFSGHAAIVAAAFAVAATLRPGLLDALNAVAARRVVGATGGEMALVCGTTDPADLAAMTDICRDYGATDIRPDAGLGAEALARYHAGSRRFYSRGGRHIAPVPVTRLTDLLDGARHIGDRYGVALAVTARSGEVEVVAVPQRGASDGQGDLAVMELDQLSWELVGEATGGAEIPLPRHPWVSRITGGAGADVDEGMKRALDRHALLNPGLLY